jgi:hypothetical protein
MALSVAKFLGSARVSRAGERVLAFANFPVDSHSLLRIKFQGKIVSAGRRNQHAGRALPNQSALPILLIGNNDHNSVDLIEGIPHDIAISRLLRD